MLLLSLFLMIIVFAAIPVGGLCKSNPDADSYMLFIGISELCVIICFVMALIDTDRAQ